MCGYPIKLSGSLSNLFWPYFKFSIPSNRNFWCISLQYIVTNLKWCYCNNAWVKHFGFIKKADFPCHYYIRPSLMVSWKHIIWEVNRFRLLRWQLPASTNVNAASNRHTWIRGLPWYFYLVINTFYHEISTPQSTSCAIFILAVIYSY